MGRHDTKPPEELSDRALGQRVERGNMVLDEIERSDPGEVRRSGRADELLAKGERALEQVKAAEAELSRREHQAITERLPLMRQLRDAGRKEPPATRWLREAQRFSHPELNGETLVAANLSEEDAAVFETLVKRKRRIASDEHAEPLTDDEKREWERILGTAAGDSELFERKRRDTQANAKLDALKDKRKVAGLPRQTLLAEPGSVQLPRFVFRWLIGHEARDGAWSLMDVGLLVAVLGAFANDDSSVFVGAQFEGEGTERALVVPGGVGADIRLHGKIAGSLLEDGSGHVRVREALRVLVANKWVEVEQKVAETRIRLGERARKWDDASTSRSGGPGKTGAAPRRPPC